MKVKCIKQIEERPHVYNVGLEYSISDHCCVNGQTWLQIVDNWGARRNFSLKAARIIFDMSRFEKLTAFL